MKRYCLVAFLAFMAVVTACKKETAERDNRKEMLTSRPWFLTGTHTITGGVEGPNTVAGLQNCTKDNTHNFQTDFMYIINEGATKCDPTHPDLVNSGPWSTNDNVDSVTWVMNSLTNRYKIVKLTRDSLVMYGAIGASSFKRVYAH